MAGKWEWMNHLTHVLSDKPAKIVQEACIVLEKHGYSVKKKLKSELYCSSTLPSCVPSTALCQLNSGTCTNCICTHTCTDHTHTLTLVSLRGINAFWAGGFCQSSNIGPSGFQRGNVHCLQLKGKPHPFTMVGLTQIMKVFVGQPGNTLEETSTIGGRPLFSSQSTLIPLW